MTRFQRLCGEHRDRVYRFALYLLGQREDAEDVTQDVLITLWREHATLEDARVGPWLTRVARNACVDAHRSRLGRGGRRPRRDDAVELDALSGAGDPEREVEAARSARELRAALSALPEPQRSIVILRELEGMSYAEIAEALEVPAARARVYLHRGRRRLREQLAHELDAGKRSS